jgi:hypothetical protein
MAKKSSAQLSREIAEVLTNKASKASGTKSLYQELRTTGIPTDHHESDLYVLDTPEARALIAKHGKRGSSFTSQIDRRRWLDVPFAYDPFWERGGRKHSTIVVNAPARSKRASKTKVVHVVQGNYGYGHGWEDLTSEDDRKEARARLSEYRQNETGVPFRLIRRRQQINP